MTTEEEVIYLIWEQVRGGEANQDDPINERLLRAFLSNHRGKYLSKAYEQGLELPDEVFQYLGPIPCSFVNGYFVSDPLPKTVKFKYNTGLMVDISSFPISIVNSEEFRTSHKNRFNKNIPLAKIQNNRLFLKNGKTRPNQLDDVSKSELNTIVATITEAEATGSIMVNTQAVLVNPDDEPNYNWTKSPYPMPDELISDMVEAVKRNDFNFYLQTKGDETGDMRNDSNQKNK